MKKLLLFGLVFFAAQMAPLCGMDFFDFEEDNTPVQHPVHRVQRAVPPRPFSTPAGSLLRSPQGLPPRAPRSAGIGNPTAGGDFTPFPLPRTGSVPNLNYHYTLRTRFATQAPQDGIVSPHGNSAPTTPCPESPDHTIMMQKVFSMPFADVCGAQPVQDERDGNEGFFSYFDDESTLDDFFQAADEGRRRRLEIEEAQAVERRRANEAQATERRRANDKQRRRKTEQARRMFMATKGKSARKDPLDEFFGL